MGHRPPSSQIVSLWGGSPYLDFEMWDAKPSESLDSGDFDGALFAEEIGAEG